VTPRWCLAVLLGLVLFATSCAGPSGTSSQTRAAVQPHQVAVPDSLRTFRSPERAAAVPVPVRVRIPSLGVDSPLERLGRSRAGTVEVPAHWGRAGWYRNGPRPGEHGAAVILGHVDSPTGPAVFAGIAGLRAGARVLVTRADGSSVAFRVTRVEQRRRSRFPVEAVYWPTLRPELRLVTCGGRYDRARGGYLSNVIVFAVQESRP
jgi:sortase (surface protein transpeptidase)